MILLCTGTKQDNRQSTSGCYPPVPSMNHSTCLGTHFRTSFFLWKLLSQKSEICLINKFGDRKFINVRTRSRSTKTEKCHNRKSMVRSVPSKVVPHWAHFTAMVRRNYDLVLLVYDLLKPFVGGVLTYENIGGVDWPGWCLVLRCITKSK